LNWWKASIATATAQIVRMAGGLLVIKLLAIYLGPTGFGRLGHFMSLIAILSVLSGGGVLNGIIKYVAEYQNNPHKLSKFLTTALLYSLFFSIIIFVLIFVFSKTISYKLFNDEKFYPTIILLSLIQLSYGLVNFCNGIVNGFRATGKYAVIIIYGTFIGVPLAYYFISNYQCKYVIA
jgi:PST family polysaccharide transporter/antigen flippase